MVEIKEKVKEIIKDEFSYSIHYKLGSVLDTIKLTNEERDDIECKVRDIRNNLLKEIDKLLSK